MMTQGIGVDIIQVGRVEAAIRRRPSILARCFTSVEREECQRRWRPAEHFAARFAAKEAVAKALGRSLSWHEVELTRREAQKPEVRLTGRALQVAAGRQVVVSMSHTCEHAVAVAVVFGGPAP
jgi:holo-[acyl-carrier protein] synthase